MIPSDEPAALKPEEPGSAEIVRSPATAAVIGLISGAISAFFGIGSGLVMAPALALLLRSRPARATGTSLALVLPIAAAALAHYQIVAGSQVAAALAGRGVSAPQIPDWPVQYGAVLLLAFGSVVGAGLFRARASGDSRYLFGALLAAMGVVLFLHPFHVAPTAVYGISTRGAVMLLAVGVVSGVVTAYLGAGGGVILVPALVFALGFPQHLAQATSLGVILLATLFGALVHVLRGNVIWSLVPWLAVGGILAGWEAMGGAMLLSDSSLRVAFGGLLAVIGIGMILSRARRKRARPNEE